MDDITFNLAFRKTSGLLGLWFDSVDVSGIF